MRCAFGKFFSGMKDLQETKNSGKHIEGDAEYFKVNWEK